MCLCEWTRKSWTAKQVKLIWQACCLEFSLKNNNFYIYIFSSCVSMSEGSSGKPFSLLIFWYTFRENYEFKVAWKLGSKSVQMPLTDSSTCMKWKNSTSTEKQKSSSQFLLLHSGELRSLSKSIAIEFRHWNFRLAQKNSSFLRLLNHWTFQN